MTQSFPTSNPEASASPKEQQTTQSPRMTDSETRYQRLMELVEAEDASNGEVGCGRDWGERLPVYLRTCGINRSRNPTSKDDGIAYWLSSIVLYVKLG